MLLLKKAIKEQKLIEHLLQVLALVEPNNIPVELFEKILELELKLPGSRNYYIRAKACIDTLYEEFSIIKNYVTHEVGDSSHFKYVSIHNSTEVALYDQFESDGTLPIKLIEVLKAMSLIVSDSITTKKQVELGYSLLPHINSLLKHAQTVTQYQSSLAKSNISLTKSMVDISNKGNAKPPLPDQYNQIIYYVAKLLNAKAHFYTQVGYDLNNARIYSDSARKLCEELAGIKSSDNYEDTFNKLTAASSKLADKCSLVTLYISVLNNCGRFYIYHKDPASREQCHNYLNLALKLCEIYTEKTGKKLLYEVLIKRNALLYFAIESESSDKIDYVNKLKDAINGYEDLLTDDNSYYHNDELCNKISKDKLHVAICHRELIKYYLKNSRRTFRIKQSS